MTNLHFESLIPIQPAERSLLICVSLLNAVRKEIKADRRFSARVGGRRQPAPAVGWDRRKNARPSISPTPGPILLGLEPLPLPPLLLPTCFLIFPVGKVWNVDRSDEPSSVTTCPILMRIAKVRYF